MCLQCQEWERTVGDLWWRVISHTTKLKALLDCAMPYFFSPWKEKMQEATEGLLRTLGSHHDVGAKIHNLATNCPHQAWLTPPQKASVESQRQEMLAGAQQRLAFLDSFLPDLKRRVEETISMGQDITSALHNSTLAYIGMMSDTLTKWRDNSLRINQQWESHWNQVKARQNILDRKEVLVFAGGSFIDLFPWNL